MSEHRLQMSLFKHGRGVAWVILIALLAAGCTLRVGETAQQATLQISGVPVVQMISPLPNATYLTNVDVNILARVTNAGADVASVEVSVDGETIATLQNPNPAAAESFSVTQTWFSMLGTHTISVRALRVDGTASESASVTVNVVEAQSPATATFTPTVAPTTQAATATNTVSPTVNAATAAPTTSTLAATASTSQAPKVRANGFANIRRGPSTNFEPPLGAMSAGDEYDILATNLTRDWLKIRYNNGEAWVSAQVVEVIGELTNVPSEAGPPIPTRPPATNTPVPAVTNTPAAPANAANLTIPSGGLVLYPTAGGGKDQIFQNEDVYVEVRVTNNGTTNSGPFVVALEIYYKDNNAPAIATATATVADLAAGADTVVSLGYKHTEGAGRVVYALAKVDPNNAVVETNNGDNQSANIEYVIGAR